MLYITVGKTMNHNIEILSRKNKTNCYNIEINYNKTATIWWR